LLVVDVDVVVVVDVGLVVVDVVVNVGVVIDVDVVADTQSALVIILTFQHYASLPNIFRIL